LDSSQETLAIWELVCRQFSFIAEKEITSDLIGRVKENGLKLFDAMKARYLDDIAITPYFHCLCFNSHIFLRRSLSLGIPLKFICNLMLVEKNQDLHKVDFRGHSNHFTSSQGPVKKMIAPDENDVNISEASLDDSKKICGHITKLKTPCQISIENEKCHFHDPDSSTHKRRRMMNVEPELEVIEHLHVLCKCPLEVHEHPKISKKIYRAGYSVDLLPTLIQEFLNEDLQENTSSLLQALPQKMQNRVELLGTRKKSGLNEHTVEDIRHILKDFGIHIPSSAKTKKEYVHLLAKAYEFELHIRISPTFKYGTVIDWNCDTLAQLLRIRWRRFAKILKKLYL
jgi:hypothetical protein